MKRIIVLAAFLIASGIGIRAWVMQSQVGETPVSRPDAVDTAASQTSTASGDTLTAPLDRAAERVTKKPFGIYITPATSPVQPEQFTGYHAGVDFETFGDEAARDVPVFAVCNGRLLQRRRASGYGGVIVQSAVLNGQPITVVYGHLRLTSITLEPGDTVRAGRIIGYLGKAFSDETDGERKHLHLAFHRGTSVNIRGYVHSRSTLEEWIDPYTYVCRRP